MLVINVGCVMPEAVPFPHDSQLGCSLCHAAQFMIVGRAELVQRAVLDKILATTCRLGQRVPVRTDIYIYIYIFAVMRSCALKNGRLTNTGTIRSTTDDGQE